MDTAIAFPSGPITPGAVIGYRRDGRPIRVIAGGDGTGDAGGGNGGTGDGAGGDAGQAGGTDGGQQGGQAPPAGSQQTGQNGAQQGGDGDVASLPDWAQRQIKELRDEAAKSRTNAKQKAAQDAEAALVQKLGKALGLVKDGDGKPDPDQLTQQLTAEQTRAREAQVHLAVYRAAGKNGGDADALLDSRSFLGKLADLDPTSNDFDAKVATAIKDAVKDNPKLAAAGQAPGRSGGDLSGGPGGAPTKPKNFADAVDKALATRHGA